MSSKKDTPLTLAYDSSSKKQVDGIKRETGIDIIGAVPWGTHLCQFYKTKDDLIDILVPYFKAGLQNNEFCMWITSEPLHVDEAKRALQKAVKNLDDYMKKGQVEILDATQWYTKSGKFDADEVLAGWVKKETWARRNGFDGLRLTGNTFWLEKKDWEDFTKYEKIINHVIGNYKMIAICSYSLDKCNASEIIDVVSNHQFALIQRDGKWHRIESPEMKKNEQERECQVRLLNQVQDGIIASDPEFRITFWNKGAEQIFGYSEVEALGKTTTELLQPIYAPGEREKIIGELNRLGTSKVKIHVKHRNGTMIITEVHTTRINNGFGDITGYVISYRDVTDYEMAQTALGEAELKYRTVADNTYDFEFWIDPNSKFLYASPSCKRITGHKTEDFLKDPTLRKKIVYPGDQAIFDDHIHEEKKYIAGEAEFRIVHKDGSVQWISHVCQPIYDRKGRYLGLRGSNRRTTEGKLIEGALRESEERLRLAQNSANVGIWDWNIQTNDLFFTPELNQLYGLAPNSIKTYQDWRNLIHLDDIERIETEREIAITNHQPFNLEFRILHRSGEIRWINAKGGAFYEKDDKAVRVLGVNIDITERKKAEEELRETRDYLENLLNYANAPIIVWDSESRIIKFNHAFEHLTGYTSNEMVDKKLSILFPKESQKESIKKINQALRGEYWESVEIPILRKDGIARTVLWNSANIYDKERKTLLATIAQGQDITERKQIEEELQKSEEKYRKIVENTTNVIMTTQPDGIISYLSPSCKEILGYSPEALIGTNPMTFHPNDEKKVKQSLSKALKGEKGSGFEYRILTKQGEIKWISHSWAPIFLNKKLQSIVSVIADITERKTVEDKIKKLNESLKHRSIELGVANKELEAFSYSVSHDLRAPLRSIDGFSQALSEDYADVLDEQGKEYIQRVRNATQRMGQMIDDMLRLSRLTRAEMTIKTVDLGQEATTIMGQFKKEDPTRKINFLKHDNLIGEGDTNLLHILLENMLGNAWKFTKKHKQAEIEFGKTQQGQETVFFIRDNGAGFNMKYANKLFIPFQRLHDDTDYPGTGIGLSIVSRIIHRHGGRIWAEAEEEKGATFYFTLGGKTNE